NSSRTTSTVDGLDLESGFVEIAQTKVPSGRFVVADMRTFDLGRHYDVVQCLFSSIGYLTHGHEVIQALQCFRQHLAAGSVILVEPWFTPEIWKVGEPFMAPPVDRPDLKICRMKRNWGQVFTLAMGRRLSSKTQEQSHLFSSLFVISD